MYTVRALLDRLVAQKGIGAIQRLCDLRGITGRGGVEAKCGSLARSYRGDHAHFFHDLRKEDLVAMLEDATELDGDEYYLPSAKQYSKPDLVEYAVKLLRDDIVPTGDAEEEEEEEESKGGNGRRKPRLRTMSDAALLGATKLVAVRGAKAFAAWLAPALDVTPATLTRRLNKEDGRTLLRNLVEGSWPALLPAGVGPALGSLRIGAMRESEPLIELVARRTNRSVARVRSDVSWEGDAPVAVEFANGELSTVFSESEWVEPERRSKASPRRAKHGHKNPRPSQPRKKLQGSVVPGQLLSGRWKILQELGSGGFASVFEARDTRRQDGRIVVLKVARDEPAAVLLAEEQVIAERLRHQNICTYLQLEHDESAGTFLVIEHAGRSLDKVIAERGALPLERVLEVARQLGAALEFAHSKNVMHHDVKPHNVLVQEATGQWEIRLADFGVAVLGHAGTNTVGAKTILATHVVGSSPGYAAPEQTQGIPKKASDQYGLALVACSMLEGKIFRAPYERRSFQQLSTAQNRALARALERDYARRFSSCADFVKALEGRS